MGKERAVVSLTEGELMPASLPLHRSWPVRAPAARFVAVDAANTALFLAVYLLFRAVLPGTVADVPASALTMVAGTRPRPLPGQIP
jgi:hypothetical protein